MLIVVSLLQGVVFLQQRHLKPENFYWSTGVNFYQRKRLFVGNANTETTMAHFYSFSSMVQLSFGKYVYVYI
jgi:hypothetical protein